MGFMVSIVLPLCVFFFGQFIRVSNGNLWLPSKRIAVNNGQIWGTWGPQKLCPIGTYATGFSLKVEESVGNGDDTALNGISLRCTKHIGYRPGEHVYTTVESSEGSWGTWTKSVWCSSGVLQQFQLRVEPNQGGGDDTAANNIKFKCTGTQILTGNGMSWGDWGKWSEICIGTGICGIQTKVEAPQGSGDDTSLNDVRFICCT